MRSLLLLAAFAFSAHAAEMPVPDNVLFTKDVEYSNAADQHLQVNIAQPKDGNGPFPAVVCIHGGGFRAGKREGYDKLLVTLAQHGYVAITVTYRLAPAYPFPAAVYDCKAAVRWLRANAAKYHVDPANIGAMGGSAGGHLAQFLGVTEGVKCVVNFYGPSDLTKSYGKSVDAAEVLPLFLGGDLTTKLKEHIIASPLYWVTPAAAPTLCLHGTADQYVAFEQAQWIVDKLKASQVEAELVPFEGALHGLKGVPTEKTDALMIAFFDKHLKTGK